ncbi:hypothetical protein GCM10023332_02840 [Luteimonas vadosa]|uniref:Uncharacterized protein n=1 Tax=Luteimonas vadosa TaxID=1165507 RepID=A0ABP9DNS5_9GAMM
MQPTLISTAVPEVCETGWVESGRNTGIPGPISPSLAGKCGSNPRQASLSRQPGEQTMHPGIKGEDDAPGPDDRAICRLLTHGIAAAVPEAEDKDGHGHAVRQRRARHT